MPNKKIQLNVMPTMKKTVFLIVNLHLFQNYSLNQVALGQTT